MEVSIEGVASARGLISIPGDKSISHRALIFSAIAEGRTKVRNLLIAEDCLSTADVLKKLGVKLSVNKRLKTATVLGKGKYGLQRPEKRLYCGNSGTTMRLMSGVLAGQCFNAALYGDKSLNLRPMARVADPLSKMGAVISGRYLKKGGKKNIFPPLRIKGRELHGTRVQIHVASAQVKSAVLLAGLYAKGITCVKEPYQSRDHTERMLDIFGVKLLKKSGWLCISGLDELKSPGEIYVPGDISSAAFFIALAVITPNSNLILEKVGINPTRAGLVDVLKKMGAKISFKNTVKSGEPYADIVVKSSKLKGVRVKAKDLPLLIDEIPILAVCASFARGKTYIENVAELRVKECDRIKALQYNLRRMGVKVEVVKKDGREDMIIYPTKLKAAKLRSFSDHRIAMAMAIAGLACEGRTIIDDGSCVNISFPEFWTLLKRVIK